MHHPTLTRWRRRAWLGVAVLVPALALAAPAAAHAAAPGGRAAPALTAEQQTAAARLAADHGLSATEARQQIARQGSLTSLATGLRRSLGAGFGGAWIDHANGGRLTVAVAGATAAGATARVHSAAAAADAAGATTTVTVRRSLAELHALSDRLGHRIAQANRGAAHGLQSAVVVQKNAIRLDLPAGHPLTAAQRSVVSWAERTLGDALLTGSYKHESRPLYCGGQYSCDPPLRDGLAIYGANVRCTSAFMAYDSYGYYMMTAGHCAEDSSWWEVPTYSYGYQSVGSVVDYTFGYDGDSSIVSVDDPSWWQPAGWVYPSSAVYSWDYDYVGSYVCKEGSTTGYTCGEVTETDATVSYPDRTLSGMTWSTACDGPGDSGSGVFYGSTAYGILSGGPDSGCGMIYEPISRALSQRGVTLLSG